MRKIKFFIFALACIAGVFLIAQNTGFDASPPADGTNCGDIMANTDGINMLENPNMVLAEQTSDVLTCCNLAQISPDGTINLTGNLMAITMEYPVSLTGMLKIQKDLTLKEGAFINSSDLVTQFNRAEGLSYNINQSGNLGTLTNQASGLSNSAVNQIMQSRTNKINQFEQATRNSSCNYIDMALAFASSDFG